MSRLSPWFTGPIVVLVAAVASPLPWFQASAQPPAADSGPDPIDLVRGLRENGMSDLALEYLADLDKKPGVPDAVKQLLPLERAKCQLESAVDEPDEGTRISMVGEAKEGFLTFVRNPKNAGHPRLPEAFLALARLSSLDAKAQLAKARRMDIPALAEDGSNQGAVDEAKKNQKAEAAKSRPLFNAATTQLKSAVTQIEAQLAKNPDPITKRSLLETLYEAKMAQGTNLYAQSESFLGGETAELAERDKKADEAQAAFSDLARLEGAPARVTGVARAWLSECEYVKKNYKAAEDEEKRVESTPGSEGDEAKRMIRFFKLRREFLDALGDKGKQSSAEAKCRDWLRQYGGLRRARNEAFATRWYLGYILQLQADATLPPPPKVPPKTPPPPPTLGALARGKYAEAEKLFRVISQTDNDYTQRAARARMYVVRRLLGEADQPPAAYRDFETCQMAALIQMARTLDLQKDPEKNAEEIKKRYHAIVALLERAREIATPQDSPADVADVNLRLIYYYQVSDQPHLAAILGEHMARTTKAPGGKSALAGALAINGYFASTSLLKNVGAERLDALKKIDRDRSIDLAVFLDKQFPNDTPTDRARHRLAGLLYEDQKPVEAYDVLLRVRPGYESISQARLFQGALAYQLLSVKDSPLAKERHREVFRRTTADLDRLVKPLVTAPEDDVRPYLTARCRLARLYLLQPRIDPDGDKLEPGFAKAKKVAEEALALVPTFDSLLSDIGTKTLNLDGWELKLVAENEKTAAAYAEGTTLFSKGKYDEAFNSIGGILGEMSLAGPFSQQVKGITTPGAKPPAPMPKKEPEKKEPEKKEPPKKEPEKKEPPKKEPEKKEPEKKGPEPAPAPENPEDDPAKAQKEQIVSLAKGVDLYRQNLIVLALKVRMKKGEAEKGIELLELLEKFGGSIDANMATLEQVTNETAAQIVSLRREGKADEANSMSAGFSKLLAHIGGKPNLPSSMHRFLGQSLIVVGNYKDAVQSLQKVPVPAPDKMPLVFDPSKIEDPVEKKAILEYRRAVLELVRAYRQDNQFEPATAELDKAMGNMAKPGWAANSVDFRKEKAYLLEAKGAAAPGAAGKQPWSEALREWTSLVNIYRGIVTKGPGTGPGAGNAYIAAQNNYFEAYLMYQRCLLKANQSLLPKGDMKFTKLYDDAGRNFATLEMNSSHRFNSETRDKYGDLLKEMPELKAAYEKHVGTLLPTAEAKAKERDKDATDLAAKAEKLKEQIENDQKAGKTVPPETLNTLRQYEDRTKMFAEDAEGMRNWAKSGGKFFLQAPAMN
ncbi:MAG: hypothetical protein U0791_27160 [Gemmataceae bacterium]